MIIIISERFDFTMKKTIATLIAVLTFGSACMSAYAASPMTAAGSDSADVKATYEAGGTSTTVYSVDLEWGAMTFTYTDAFEGTWNPATHSYDGATAASWAATGNTVKVTNHSNKAVDVTFAYAKASGYESVTGTLDVTNQVLATAVGTEVASAPNVTSTLTLSGALDSSATTATKVGTVTVTIA